MAMFKCSGALFNGTIIINTTAGATVTATTSGTTRAFTAVANASGVATIRVKKRGTYAIASTGTTHIGHATVSTNTPVTAYYIWNKYNTVHTWGYYQTSEYMLGTFEASEDYATYDAMSFDTSTGVFTVSGKSSRELQHYATGYYVQPSGYVWYPTASSSWTGTEVCQVTKVDNFRSGWEGYVMDSYVVKLVRNSDTTKSRGTYIAQVTSTSLSAYSEGYNSDGYWYNAA